MRNEITAYHQDEEQHWVARLKCGHFQHVRHDPPWTNRDWVTSVEGRRAKLGLKLYCKKCERKEAADYDVNAESQ